MTLKDLPIGEIFQFHFDRGSRWAYKKLSDTEIECVDAPKTFSKIIGSKDLVDELRLKKVKLIPGC